MKNLILIAILPFLTACPLRKGPVPAPAAVTPPNVEKVDEKVSQAVAKLELQAKSLTTVEERILFAQKVAEEIERLTRNENATPVPTPRP
jgi:predicted small lipoprotein YifL